MASNASHAGRRPAVILMYASYIAGAALQWREDEIVREPQRWIILGLFGMAVLAGAWLYFRSDYWRLAQAPLSLDERERASRNATFVHAYAIATIAAIGCMAWLWLGFSAAHRPLGGVDFNVLFWGYVWFVTTLPSAMLAWTALPLRED